MADCASAFATISVGQGVSTYFRGKGDVMLNIRAAAPEAHAQLIPGQSARPVLTRLALLAAANPLVAESLMRDSLDAAAMHPHYAFTLDARDRATLDAIRERANTVGEFLSDLADIVDGAA